MGNTSRKFTAAFKAKVALEAIQEQSTVAEISQRHPVHSKQVYTWKRELLEKADRVFGGEVGSSDASREGELLKKIGELTVERDFLARGLERIPRK